MLSITRLQKWADKECKGYVSFDIGRRKGTIFLDITLVQGNFISHSSFDLVKDKFTEANIREHVEAMDNE